MGYKRYEKYKDSGVEWIGEIPEGWDLVKIKFISFMYSGNGFNEEYQGKTEGNYPFYKVSDINGDGKFVTIANNYVNKIEVEKNRWNIIPENSVLFPKIGEALKKNHRKINVSKCLIDNNTAALKPNKELMDINYFYYLLCCVNGEWFVNPGAVPSIDNGKLKNFKVVFPPKIEQTAIANFLDQKTAEIDSLIADKEKMIQLLQEKRQVIITEAVTKGVDRNVPMKDSGVEWIGEIPEGWNCVPLKRIVSTKITDGPHETPILVDDGIPFISAEAVKGGKIDFDLKRGFISLEDHKRFSKKCKPQKGDIFLVKSGATTGNIAYVDTDIEFNIWSPLAVIRCNSNKVIDRFIYYFMSSSSFRKQVETNWSYGTQQNIGMGVIENLFVTVPQLFEQHEIVKFLDKKTSEIDSIIEEINSQIAKLKEYRQSLIYEAVTGKIDVRDFTLNTEGEVTSA